jgi:pilus assembly protein Flp/PilA
VHEVIELIAHVQQRLRSEDGATAVEYALMVALIAMVVIAAVTFLGQATNQTFQGVGSAVSSS